MIINAPGDATARELGYESAADYAAFVSWARPQVSTLSAIERQRKMEALAGQWRADRGLVTVSMAS